MEKSHGWLQIKIGIPPIGQLADLMFRNDTCNVTYPAANYAQAHAVIARRCASIDVAIRFLLIVTFL